MSTVKEKILSILSQLPEDCSLEDVQYHLYVLEKIRQGLVFADTEPTLPQEDVEGLLNKWFIE